MKIIVTDLTRFNNPSIVCMAGIREGATQCVRPMPYLERSECERVGIFPGSILRVVSPADREFDELLRFVNYLRRSNPGGAAGAVQIACFTCYILRGRVGRPF